MKFIAGPAHGPSRLGFRITYNTIAPPTTEPPTTRPTTATTQPPTQAGCGGRLTTASGSLQSPNWPQTYPVDIECEWTIELPDPNNRISLSFNDQAFGLAGLMPACSKDTLTIYDGLGNTAIRTLCDTAIPIDITTTSNTARVKFIAGPAHGPARLGFRITYNTIVPPTTQPPTTRPTTATTQPPTARPTTATTQPPTQAGCGGRLTTASGSLQSPNWPETYNVDEVCEWTIELPDTMSTIRITFDRQEFGIAGYTPVCLKDVLEIFNGLGTNDARFNSICGINLPDPITTSSNAARIVFTAGPAHGSGRKGFKLDYNSIDPSRILPNSPILNPTGMQKLLFHIMSFLSLRIGSLSCRQIFTSPTEFGPSNYPGVITTSNVGAENTCFWTYFASRSGVRCRFTLLDFDIPTGCQANSLKVYDGSTDQSTLLATMCGDNAFVEVVSSGRFLSLKLKVTSFNRFRGFYGRFNEVA